MSGVLFEARYFARVLDKCGSDERFPYIIALMVENPSVAIGKSKEPGV